MYKSMESDFKWNNSGGSKVQFILLDVVEIVFEGIEEFCLNWRGVSCDANEEVYRAFEVGSV